MTVQGVDLFGYSIYDKNPAQKIYIFFHLSGFLLILFKSVKFERRNPQK